MTYVTHKKSALPNPKKFFQVPTRRLAVSFEPLKNSLPLTAPQLRAPKAMCNPVVLARKSLKVAVCQSVKDGVISSMRQRLVISGLVL